MVHFTKEPEPEPEPDDVEHFAIETAEMSVEVEESIAEEPKTFAERFKKQSGMYMAAVSCLLSAISTGMVLGYTAPAGPKMEKSVRLHLSQDSSTWFGSTAAIGALFGGLLGGPFSDRVGRRSALIFCGIPCFIGWLVIAFSRGLPQLLVGRALTGFFSGLTCAVAPQYLTEISTVETRGFLGSSFQLCIVIGVLVATLIGSLKKVDWNWLAIDSTVPVVLMMAAMVFMPESPEWLMGKNLVKQAASTTVFLHGRGQSTAKEMLSMSTRKGSLKDDKKFTFSMLRRREYYLPAIYSLALMFFQQFCGINAVVFYTTDIFKSAGSTLDPTVATIIVDAIQVVATLIGSILMDKAGRRILLLASGGGITLSLLVIGLFYLLVEKLGTPFQSSFGWMGVACLSVMVATFSIGYGPIPWMIISEIVPQNAKGIVGGVSTAFNWGCVFIITKTFKTMITNIHEDFTYWFYAVVAVGSCVFTWFCIPETKGKTLEEITKYFQSGGKPSTETVDSEEASVGSEVYRSRNRKSVF